jgi:transcriptional regulator with XRE-family HTH domain
MVMAASGFGKRFKEVIRGLSDAELGSILGVTTDAARKMRTGRIKSLKLEAALRLARELRISPWYLAGEAEPAMRLRAGPSSDRQHRARPPKPDHRLDRAELETAESALLLHDEVVELRARMRRMEAAVEELQSRAKASAAR